MSLLPPRKNKFLRHRGFTLIELLIVVVIIAILAGVLLPALNKTRNTAQTTACKNKQKQLYTSLCLYHEDHKSMPLTSMYRAANNSGETNWSYFLASGGYLKAATAGKAPVWRCHVATPGDTNNSHINTSWQQSYGLATRFQGESANLGGKGIRLGAVSNSSDWPFFADSVHTNKKQWFKIDGSDARVCVTRHDKTANVAFLDGSVRSETRSSLKRFRDAGSTDDRYVFRNTDLDI